VAVPGGERADHDYRDERVPGGVYGRDEGVKGGYRASFTARLAMRKEGVGS
jgi:hypothetical protein